jgi:hypothetical protein
MEALISLTIAQRDPLEASCRQIAPSYGRSLSRVP